MKRIIALALLFAPLSSMAGIIYTATASTSDGSALDAVTLGAQIVVDVNVTTTTAEALAAFGSINDYDTSVVTLNAGLSSVSSSLFHEVCFPGFGCFNGITNLIASPVEEVGIDGPGAEVNFLAAASTTPARGDGTLDPSPQFRLVFDAIGAAGTSTVLRIGTFADYGDSYTGGDGAVTNTSIAITLASAAPPPVAVPEPGALVLLGLGLVGLFGARRSRA